MTTPRLEDHPAPRPAERHWVVPKVAATGQSLVVRGDTSDMRLILAELAVTSAAGLPCTGDAAPWYSHVTLLVTDDLYDMGGVLRMVMNGHGLTQSPKDLAVHVVVPTAPILWPELAIRAQKVGAALLVVDVTGGEHALPARPPPDMAVIIGVREPTFIPTPTYRNVLVQRSTVPSTITLHTDGAPTKRAGLHLEPNMVRFAPLPLEETSSIQDDILTTLYVHGPSPAKAVYETLNADTPRRKAAAKAALDDLVKSGLVKSDFIKIHKTAHLTRVYSRADVFHAHHAYKQSRLR